MKVEQIYTGCLAEAAYYIESNGEAAIIDPLRETQPYIEKAEENGAKIKYVFLTHFHADFVSGHLDLAKKTGATIVYGPTAKTQYEIHEGKDGELFNIGDVKIELLHTPGHTMESSTFLLIDEKGNKNAIFSGDTLFLGDVGRPDLAIKSDLTKEDLAGYLFDSLRNKIMVLPDETIVYPGHGAGSACGKNMSKETVGKLGDQKKFNYALRADMTREEFVIEVLDGIQAPPQYFSKNAMMNKQGYQEFDQVLAKGNIGLDADTVEAMSKHEGALVLDVRSADDFAQGHVPGAMFIGLDGQFAPWVGALIEDINQPIVLVTPEGREEESITRLSRVGYDNTLGYLKGGMAGWKAANKDIADVNSVSAEEFAIAQGKSPSRVVDVRREGEYLSEHVIDAENLPLDYINDYVDQLNTGREFYLHCAGGYRSMIAASILKANGVSNFIDVAGGFAAIKNTEAKVSDYVCPSTL
ncbi:MAG: rhodanese-like domain-containing protein [Cyclobacteriaceae bacterium]|nr:rhodanese-like domain-containing protein [Cyclobacteriaceae bacterium]